MHLQHWRRWGSYVRTNLQKLFLKKRSLLIRVFQRHFLLSSQISCLVMAQDSQHIISLLLIIPLSEPTLVWPLTTHSHPEQSMGFSWKMPRTKLEKYCTLPGGRTGHASQFHSALMRSAAGRLRSACLCRIHWIHCSRSTSTSVLHANHTSVHSLCHCWLLDSTMYVCSCRTAEVMEVHKEVYVYSALPSEYSPELNLCVNCL